MLQYSERKWEIEARKKRNLPLPDWASNSVSVPTYLLWFWEAFWALDTCRHYAGDYPKSIPWTAIKDYAEFHKIDVNYTYAIISKMDEAYLKYVIDVVKKEYDSVQSQTKGKKRRK